MRGNNVRLPVERSFSQQLLAELRAAGYRPAAWGAMLATSWRQARQTARAQPRLVGSWRQIAALLSLLTLTEVGREARRDGALVAFRHNAPLLIVTATQLGDSYVHLGLHRHTTGQPHLTLGPAMALTAARGWAGAWLLTRLLHSRPIADDEFMGALAVIVLTDIMDGPLARRTDRASALGRYLDGEADLVAWTALTLTQLQRGDIPAWFLGAFACRWGAPLLLGFGRTFAQAEPVVVAPSWVGRAAGAAQVTLACTGLLAARQVSQPQAQQWRRWRDRVALGTAALMGAATITHLRRFLRQ